jgi:phage terminase small subunit
VLQGRAAERAEVTTASLIAEAEEAREEAMKSGQYSAAVSAIREKGVLSGRRLERSERGMPGEFADLDNMSADELRAALERELEAAGLRLVAIDAGIGAGSPGSKPN